MAATGVLKATSDDRTLEWSQRGSQQLFLADAIDGDDQARMTVGFARYGAGESNEWDMVYDEALVVTKGQFSVDSEGTTTEAGVGEVIYLLEGTPVVYRAIVDSELVYVSYPHWLAATERSEFADRLAQFVPVTIGL